MFRSTMRHDPANCKVYFAKIRFFLFFLFTIRFYSQRYITFAPRFKKRCKINKNNLKKQILWENAI